MWRLDCHELEVFLRRGKKMGNGESLTKFVVFSILKKTNVMFSQIYELVRLNKSRIELFDIAQ